MTDIIPAIDIIDGACVRLTQGDYNAKSIYGKPIDMALAFEAAGCKRLHMVDLDGAKSRHIVNVDVLKEITSKTSLTVDFGGGIKTDEDIRTAFQCGAAMVTIGSVAVTDPTTTIRWIEQYGADRIILGADVKHGKIAINGWKEESAEDLHDFIGMYVKRGITKVLCTDISRDGTLKGPNISLYESIMEAFPNLYLIVSGGISSAEDIQAVARAGLPAVVFGKAYYEGKITIGEIKTLIDTK